MYMNEGDVVAHQKKVMGLHADTPGIKHWAPVGVSSILPEDDDLNALSVLLDPPVYAHPPNMPVSGGEGVCPADGLSH